MLALIIWRQPDLFIKSEGTEKERKREGTREQKRKKYCLALYSSYNTLLNSATQSLVLILYETIQNYVVYTHRTIFYYYII